jgi:hypothetical protein
MKAAPPSNHLCSTDVTLSVISWEQNTLWESNKDCSVDFNIQVSRIKRFICYSSQVVMGDCCWFFTLCIENLPQNAYHLYGNFKNVTKRIRHTHLWQHTYEQWRADDEVTSNFISGYAHKYMNEHAKIKLDKCCHCCECGSQYQQKDKFHLCPNTVLYNSKGKGKL